jgi:hypothetical protein
MGVLMLILFALQAPVSCPDVPSCRTEAEAAATRGDYETFHDFAWRAVQKGKPNDSSLMLLLARAQSLSGRPDDALVMLGRLADLHVAVDTTIPDFERARRQPGWDAVATRLSRSPGGASGDKSSSAPVGGSAPATGGAAGDRSAVAEAVAARAGAAPGADASEALTFDAPGSLGAFAIAHDAVSRRFVIGDAPSRRLLVVDEVSKHVVPYVSAASAGFYDDLTAFTVDARRGDLWVVSTKGSTGESTSIVHKLQLVSGRGLMEVHPAESLQSVRFVDVAVTPDGTVFALDAAGGRLFRLRSGSRALDVILRVDAPNPSALAAADDRVVFVATDRGLLRIDTEARAVQPVKSVEDLSGFTSLAWRNGALVGVQHANGASLAVRVALDGAGIRAQPRAILVASADSIVGTLADGTFYYLLNGAIHRVAVR